MCHIRCSGGWIKEKAKERGCHGWGCSHCDKKERRKQPRTDNGLLNSKKTFCLWCKKPVTDQNKLDHIHTIEDKGEG